MFVKTDLAAYLNSWDQKPYLVSLGPQKNFLIFNEQIQKDFQDKPDQFDDYYFDLIIGKKILYDGIYSVVNKKNGINFILSATALMVVTLGWARRGNVEGHSLQQLL